MDQISLMDLIAPCYVIDISEKINAVLSQYGDDIGASYLLSLADITEAEQRYGTIPEKCIVVIRTGWSDRWVLGPKPYLGYDESTDGPYDVKTSNLNFPGISAEAAHTFVSRRVAAVGVDTASIDAGSSKDFIVHKILLQAGIYGIENLNNRVRELPCRGSTLFVMPVKIKGGSGAPARVVALFPTS